LPGHELPDAIFLVARAEVDPDPGLAAERGPMKRVFAPGGSPAPTRAEYLRIIALRILRGEEPGTTYPADEIAEATAIANASGVKKSEAA
jgi:hypothetical protein